MSPLTLAMHMSNELLSVPVTVVTLAIAFGAVAVASRKSRNSMQSERLPLMGVMGAFVFAAQMINFTLPGLGTSGHLGGAVLLAILLGRANAIITMCGILIIQCLLFQDGGLLALGCNIINMGIVPAVVGYAVYRAALGESSRATPGRQYLAAWVACLVGVVSGAALVPVEATVSGILQVPLLEFTGVMVGVHLLIALVEGLITFAVLAYLRRTRPSVLGLEPVEACRSALFEPGATPTKQANRLSRAALSASIIVTAMLLAGVVSGFASKYPDGLESAWAYVTGKYHAEAAPSPAAVAADDIQKTWSPMPYYDWHVGWLSMAGIAGTSVALIGGWGVSRLLGRRRNGFKDAQA